jgi:glyoxylase-like metal-dependent hydrolase (beta-lactamase superfamily II)
MRGIRVGLVGLPLLFSSCAPGEAPALPSVQSAVGDSATTSWCGALPRAVNAAFERIPVPGDWHEVYQVEPGVFAIVEPRQFQEAISYLIVGTSRALLFDSGIGLVPLRPVINALTTLPVSVLNSHSHFDHVGANYEFTDVLALDHPFTRANERGKPHESVASEVAADAFCGRPPAVADTATFRSRSWRVARRVAGGDTIDLGGRLLEVVTAPGHTPDAIVLLDRANGLLLTGDSYYDSVLWFFSAETDIAAYEETMTRLAALAPTLRRLLPAHNTVSAAPSRLSTVAAAVRTLREGGGVRRAQGTQEQVTIGDVRFLVRASDPAAAAPDSGRR